MIAIKSFDIKEYEAFNKFIKKNPPRSTEKQSGIIFHSDHILVIYDDGVENTYEKRGYITSELESTRRKMWLIEHKLNTAKLSLAKVKPEGYVSGMSNNALQKLLKKLDGVKDEKGTESEYIPADKLDSVRAQIEGLENTILLDTHEFERLGFEVSAFEKMLKELDAKEK